MTPTLLVVAKSPVPGHAKTRLCPPLTPAESAQVAASALLDTLAAVEAAAAALASPRPVVAWDGDVAAGARRSEVAKALSRCRVVPQVPGPFGERLVAAHQVAGQDGGGVVQIGMDTPQVTIDHLVEAAEALREAPSALGPAHDGGWWVLGLRDPRAASVLTGVPMSQADTATLTLAALRDRGLTVAPLPTLRDVDTWEDARTVAHGLPGAFGQTVRDLALSVV